MPLTRSTTRSSDLSQSPVTFASSGCSGFDQNLTWIDRGQFLFGPDQMIGRNNVSSIQPSEEDHARTCPDELLARLSLDHDDEPFRIEFALCGKALSHVISMPSERIRLATFDTASVMGLLRSSPLESESTSFRGSAFPNASPLPQQ